MMRVSRRRPRPKLILGQTREDWVFGVLAGVLLFAIFIAVIQP